MSPGIQPKIAEVISRRWEWTDQSFTHPHNNDYVEIYYFKSPRMTRFANLHENTDLTKAEARSVALEALERFKNSLKDEIGADLEEYFTKHPNELHTTTNLNISLFKWRD
jgi:hypothetical protein